MKTGLSLEMQHENGTCTYRIFYGQDAKEALFRLESSDLGRNLLDMLNFIDLFPMNEAFFTLAEKYLDKTETVLLFCLFISEASRKENYRVKDFAAYIEELAKPFLEEISKLYWGRVSQRTFKLCFMLQTDKDSGGFTGLRSQDATNFFENIMFLLYLEKNRLHRCQECGRFFIRKKFQAGTLCYYQDRDGYTCIEKRSRRNVLARKKAHPILEEYRRRYKKNYMRVDRMIQRDKLNILPAQYPPFRAWQKEAGAYRKAYVKGRIDKAAFILALDSIQDLEC